MQDTAGQTSDSDVEHGLDEVTGTADGLEQEDSLEKKKSQDSHASAKGGPYLNASGMEKAE
jgi:hypothetical protein